MLGVLVLLLRILLVEFLILVHFTHDVHVAFLEISQARTEQACLRVVGREGVESILADEGLVRVGRVCSSEVTYLVDSS